MLTIPTLVTERLKMEPLTLAHSQGMYDLWADASVCKYSGPVTDYRGNVIDTPVASHNESDLIIDFWQRAVADGWGLRWAILSLDEDDAFIGTVGFNSLTACTEIAFHLLPQHRGQGFMTEASEAAIDWRRGIGATEIEAFIEPENISAIALARRLGMKATDAVVERARRHRMSL